MFDIGWTEMLVVAIVAILFVGPRELPGMLRTIGKSVKSLRRMAGDFQRQFDDALREAELDGVKDTLNDVRKLNPTSAIKDKLNPLKDELEDVKKTVESSARVDPSTLFDESKAPEIEEPVKVDVDAALDRQRKLDEEAAKVPPSSGVNAVPGFGGTPGKSEKTATDAKSGPAAVGKPGKPAATKSVSTAKKTAAKPRQVARAPTAAKTASVSRTSRSAASRKKPASGKTSGEAGK